MKTKRNTKAKQEKLLESCFLPAASAALSFSNGVALAPTREGAGEISGAVENQALVVRMDDGAVMRPNRDTLRRHRNPSALQQQIAKSVRESYEEIMRPDRDALRLRRNGNPSALKKEIAGSVRASIMKSVYGKNLNWQDGERVGSFTVEQWNQLWSRRCTDVIYERCTDVIYEEIPLRPPISENSDEPTDDDDENTYEKISAEPTDDDDKPLTLEMQITKILTGVILQFDEEEVQEDSFEEFKSWFEKCTKKIVVADFEGDIPLKMLWTPSEDGESIEVGVFYAADKSQDLTAVRGRAPRKDTEIGGGSWLRRYNSIRPKQRDNFITRLEYRDKSRMWDEKEAEEKKM